MSKYQTIKYDKPRERIQNYIKEGKTKEEIFNAGSKKVGFIHQFLQVNNESEGWPNLTADEWYDLVEIEFEEAKSMSDVKIEEGVTFSSKERNKFQIPEHTNSTWQLFVRKVLREQNNFDEHTIKNIENDVHKIIQNLNIKSARKTPVKGLTIGSVQSGKTTNMAALMAMAADMGFNMFIVLSGMIENLRVQNETRIYDMLNPTSGKSINWIRISNERDHLDSLHKVYQEGRCLFTVVLKNKNRLESLIDWIQEDKNIVKDLKILVIDDESDQASVNTSAYTTKDRTTINRLIGNLIYNKDKNGKDYPIKYKTINYVGYTATPYANILSEPPKVDGSLYPNTFITTLSKSNRYLGPTEIFGELGTENEGLDIINFVENPLLLNELKDAKEITQELKDSISYFIGAGASLRAHNLHKPVSMLIQVSHKLDDHFNIMQGIKSWIHNNPNEVYQNVKRIWELERERITIKDISKVIMINKNTLRPHNFDEIKENVKKIIQILSPISIDENNNQINYHDGIHLVVDNSDDRLKGSNKKYRLEYPTKEEDLNRTPLFLIIGGNTLSRGLTIEGLICTYFLRRPSAGDTLTQMGRWFGYRINYELYPRIWATKKTYNDFQYISTVEQELRDEIVEMNKIGTVPEEVGPNIKYLPQYINITSREKSRAMIATKFDFTGYSSQTYIFDSDDRVQSKNVKVAENFINSLGKPTINKNYNKDGIYWTNVSPKKIINNLFKKFKFNNRIKSLNNIEEFNQWVLKNTKKGNLNNWNVILGGQGKANDSKRSNWNLKHVSYNKVTRTKKRNSLDGEINIGVLRSPADLYADVDLMKLSVELRNEVENNIKSGVRSEYSIIREKLGLEQTPQLIIYKIDKDSKPTENSKREKLGINTDLIGLYISIPGKRNKRYETYVTVDIKNDVESFIEEGDIND